jgi:hypothetical protein
MTDGPETEPSGQGLAEAADPESEPGLALIEQGLGHTLGQKERASVGAALTWLADAWRSHRSSAPDGTEPDFVFRPTSLSRGNKPTQAGGEVVPLAEQASPD